MFRRGRACAKHHEHVETLGCQQELSEVPVAGKVEAPLVLLVPVPWDVPVWRGLLVGIGDRDSTDQRVSHVMEPLLRVRVLLLVYQGWWYHTHLFAQTP